LCRKKGLMTMMQLGGVVSWAVAFVGAGVALGIYLRTFTLCLLLRRRAQWMALAVVVAVCVPALMYATLGPEMVRIERLR
jgi:hypothetical protein